MEKKQALNNKSSCSLTASMPEPHAHGKRKALYEKVMTCG